MLVNVITLLQKFCDSEVNLSRKIEKINPYLEQTDEKYKATPRTNIYNLNGLFCLQRGWPETLINRNETKTNAVGLY